MKIKVVCKITIDFIMTILLLLLMSVNIVGQELHEWFGAGMLVVFIIHNILNYKWHKNMLKGKYSIYRILQTLINISIFITMICSMISGIMMSGYVFKFISLKGNLSLAREVHMASAYFGFVLISFHLGMHWNMIINMLKKLLNNTKDNNITKCIKFAGVLIACYGAYAFVKHDILLNMFLINKFAFYDSSQNVVLFFLDYLSIMGLWIFISHYTVKLLKKAV